MQRKERLAGRSLARILSVFWIMALVWQLFGGTSAVLSMPFSADTTIRPLPIAQSATPTPRPTRLFTPSAGAAANAAANSAANQDALVVDLGFRPKPHGLPFENYADGYENLTSVEMQRLFGDAVCGAQPAGGCILSPPARQWMERYNQAMSGGGHCFGFSVLSLLIYADAVDPLLFNAANPAELALADNVALQREIAYAWTFQALDSVRAASIRGAPSDILDALIAYLDAPDPSEESYTLAFVNRRGRGGHAVTPYAVEDLGNDQFAVHIYDNNLPGIERSLLIDRRAETWNYVASVNPNSRAARYDGDAETRSLFLFPTTPGLGVQPCPFCAQTDGAEAGEAEDGTFGLFNQLHLSADDEGRSQLILTDDEGRQYGYVDGELVAEIPGVEQFPVFTADLWQDTQSPVINVPVGVNFSVRIDGSDLRRADTADLVMIGPGYTLGVRNVAVDPDGDPSVLFPAADGTSLRFEGGQDSAPTFFVGIETDGADYEFQFDGLELAEGTEFNLALDAENGRISVDLDDADIAADYDLLLRRIDEDGESIFSHTDLSFDPESVLYLDYSEWNGDDDLPLEIDLDGDGEIDFEESLLDESYQFCDEDGCFDEYGDPIAERYIECEDDGVCYDEFGDPLEVECDADGLCFDVNGDLINAVFVACDADGCYDEDGTPIEESFVDCDEDGVCYDEDGNPIEESFVDCDEDGVCYDEDGKPIEEEFSDEGSEDDFGSGSEEEFTEDETDFVEEDFPLEDENTDDGAEEDFPESEDFESDPAEDFTGDEADFVDEDFPSEELPGEDKADLESEEDFFEDDGP